MRRIALLIAYIGTYTGGPSRGIYRLELDLASGALTSRGLAAESVNPSFLAVHPSWRFLDAVGEIGEFEGQRGGAVTAFHRPIERDPEPPQPAALAARVPTM